MMHITLSTVYFHVQTIKLRVILPTFLLKERALSSFEVSNSDFVFVSALIELPTCIPDIVCITQTTLIVVNGALLDNDSQLFFSFDLVPLVKYTCSKTFLLLYFNHLFFINTIQPAWRWLKQSVWSLSPSHMWGWHSIFKIA